MSDGPSERGVRLRPGVAIIAMGGAVQLRAGDEEIHVIETDAPEVVEKILHQLARASPRSTILKTVGAEHGPLVDALVEQLAAGRLLLDQPIPGSDEISIYLSHFMGDVPCVEVQRPSGPVLVTGHGACVDLLSRAVTEHGIEASAAQDASGLDDDPIDARIKAVVCIWERPDLAMVLRANAAACRHGKACLFVDLSHGRHVTLGPFYVPGEGACFQCFRDRWRQNTAALAEFEAAESATQGAGGPLAAYGILPAFRYQVVGMACGELFAFLSRHRPVRTLNRVATVDLEDLKLWTEPAWQIPWCPVCGAGT